MSSMRMHLRLGSCATAVASCPGGHARRCRSCCHWNLPRRRKSQVHSRSSSLYTARKQLWHGSSGLLVCNCNNIDGSSHSGSGRVSTKASGGIRSPKSSRSGGGSSSDVLALDVEYVHLAPVRQQLLGRGRISILPAEVCLAAPDGVIAFHSFCRPDDDIMAAARHAGGVPEVLWGDAPPLSEVVAHVRATIAGRRIVGHGLGKDLAALGIEHPRGLQVDTVAWPPFQGPGGQARPLAALVQQLLGRSIQADGHHSAREDAQAVLELYLQHVVRDTTCMDADALREYELQQIMEHAQQNIDAQDSSSS